MERVKVNPESKRSLEIVVVDGNPKSIKLTFGYLPEFSSKNNVPVCQVEGEDDVYKVFFFMQDFFDLGDEYIVKMLHSIMEEIDTETGDPDPNMDIKFVSFEGYQLGIPNVALNEMFDRIISMMGNGSSFLKEDR